MLAVLAGALGAGALVLLYAAVIERNWFALRRHRVPCLPPGSQPLRILHLSDLHLRAGQRAKRRFLARCAAISPDLVVGTGDFLGDAGSVEATASSVGAIRGRLGALFVLGSNDYYGPRPKSPLVYFRARRRHIVGRPNPWNDLVEALEGNAWTLINNRAMRLDGIDVVGLDDPHISRDDLTVATARDDDRFRLAVVHSPDAAPALAGLGYDLIVCGHTHGGQVRIPGIGALVTNSTLPRQMARGLHRLGGAWLHVSAGLGTSMYAPVRFACRPEACLLELTPRE
jgi:hypothetical protein